MMLYNLIVLLGPKLEIGLNTKEGKFLLPWDKSEEAKEARKSDLGVFKEITCGSGGNVVIMGKNTWLSMYRMSDPFPILLGRLNIVLTSDPDLLGKSNEQIIFLSSFEEALKAAEQKVQNSNGQIWVIGGEKTYMNLIDSDKPFSIKIHYQSDHIREDCNVFFPSKIRGIDILSLIKDHSVPRNGWFEYLIQ